MFPAVRPCQPPPPTVLRLQSGDRSSWWLLGSHLWSSDDSRWSNCYYMICDFNCVERLARRAMGCAKWAEGDVEGAPIVCHNPDEAERAKARRDELTRLTAELARIDTARARTAKRTPSKRRDAEAVSTPRPTALFATTPPSAATYTSSSPADCASTAPPSAPKPASTASICYPLPTPTCPRPASSPLTCGARARSSRQAAFLPARRVQRARGRLLTRKRARGLVPSRASGGARGSICSLAALGSVRRARCRTC